MVSDTMTLFSPERTLFVQELESKKRVFDTLATLLSYKQTQLSKDEIFDYLLDREKLGSTTLGSGLALPRARVSIDAPYAALLVLEEGILIDSPDKQPVTAFIALLVPETSHHIHSAMISKLISNFSQQPLAKELAEINDPQIAITYIETLFEQSKAA